MRFTFLYGDRTTTLLRGSSLRLCDFAGTLAPEFSIRHPEPNLPKPTQGFPQSRKDAKKNAEKEKPRFA